MVEAKKQNRKQQGKRQSRGRSGPRKNNRPRRQQEERDPLLDWKPTTELGKLVKNGTITDIDQVFDGGYTILEAEIVNTLLPNLGEDLLLVGQAKGKFGGGQRRIFRQTQKKTREGNKIQFMSCAVVGNRDGYVGVSFGKSKETVPARDKAKRKARLNLIRIRRGCGSWATDARQPNSIPFAVEGKCGSVKVKLMPAPPGKGLCIEKECAKILSLAGVKDVWSKTEGQTKTKVNLIYALIDALKKLSEVRVRSEDIAKLGIIEGRAKGQESAEVVTPVAENPSEEDGNASEVEEASQEIVQEAPQEA